MEKNKDTETKVSKNEYLIISQKYMELVYYTNNVLKKYPKSEKFALVQEIKQTVYDGLKSLVYATKIYYKYDKQKYLTELDIQLVILKTLVRISYKNKYISVNNYEAWSTLITDICNLLGGWMKSCQKK